MSPSPPAEPVRIDRALLATMALPDHGRASGKDDRGTVLVVGGTRETPGGVELAGLAALRAGAGRIHLATVESVAVPLAVRFPEARVTGLTEAADGGIEPDAVSALRESLPRVDVVLVGTGARDPAPVEALVERLVTWRAPHATVVFDAAAIPGLGPRPEVVERLDGRAVVIPNVTEMAILLGIADDDVLRDPVGVLDRAIAWVGAPVALRDSTTWIGDPGGRRFLDEGGPPALGTPGSGDVLAGILAGFLARGADATTALVWAVHAHAAAGWRVNGGRLGLLARELADQVPGVLGDLEGPAA